MNRRGGNVISAVDFDAATLQLGEGKLINEGNDCGLNISIIDFTNTHCLMNPEVKLLLETYIQKRIEDSGTIPFNQPTA